jgi:hypothetical protein
MYIRLHENVRYYFQSLMKVKKFLDRLSKNIHIPNFVKICSVGIELFHAEGRKEGQNDAEDNRF